jgi:hypothetical protein
MRRHLLVVAGLAAAGGVAAWLLPRAIPAAKRDGCLDRGGRWDSSRQACRFAAEHPAGRLRLTDAAARRLGLRERTLAEVDSLRVPPAVRTRVNRLRGELGGDTFEVVRYYAGQGGRLAALIPSSSFEGGDPHVVTTFGRDGSPRLGLPSYAAVEVFCPASGRMGAHGSARDSADGCRYFHTAQPSQPPPLRPGPDP